jgi:hypothetical protein
MNTWWFTLWSRAVGRKRPNKPTQSVVKNDVLEMVMIYIISVKVLFSLASFSIFLSL